MAEFVHVYNDGGGIRNVPTREGATRFTTNRVLFQSGIPFWLPPGDGGANGLIFTGTRGVFTVSVASPMQYAAAFTRNCYCYLPAGSGGLVTGGWYWCQMTDDTNGEIFQEMYSGFGQPGFVSSPTQHPNLTATRITQTLSEVTAITVTIPGNSLGPNGILRTVFAARQTSSATTKGMRVRIAGISFGTTGSTTSSGVADYESWFQNQGTSQKQSRVSGNVGRAHSNAPTMPSTDSSGISLDTSVDTQLTGTLYLGATTDSVIAVFRQVSVEYGA